jgi:6-phosphogluconolactonase
MLAEVIADVDGRCGHARVAIPGGSALAAVRIAREASVEPWRRASLTWVDERCVDVAHPDSNRGSAYRAGALDASHPVALELPLREDGEPVDVAIARVDRALSEHFGGALDASLLGMGEDGHVASLFPGLPVGAGRVAHVAASPKPPAERLTLTRAMLATASRTILVAAGEGKRAALTRLLAGDATLPAHGLPGLVVVTDLMGLELEGQG